jgi:hypothetical protein
MIEDIINVACASFLPLVGLLLVGLIVRFLTWKKKQDGQS